MIKANELRIGNLVEVDDIHMRVSQIFDNGVTCNDNNDIHSGEAFNNIEPIPITPEILEQCGFKQSKNHHSEFFIKTNIGNNSLMIKLGYKFKHENNWWPEVKYVHQLQNLYFALTGTELPINL